MTVEDAVEDTLLHAATAPAAVVTLNKSTGASVEKPVRTWSAGDLACCRLFVRGIVKDTECMVIAHGAWQTIVACPGECALAVSGDWAQCTEDGAWQIRTLPCNDSDQSCAAVFYAIDSRSLSATALPRMVTFTSSNGRRATPSIQTPVQIESDFLRMETLLCGDTARHALYHEVCIGEESRAFFHNSVLVIPDFLRTDECYVLMDAGDRCARCGSNAASFYSYQEGLHRYPIRKLDLEAQMLSKSILSDRLLPFIEQNMPELAMELFEQSSGLKDMKCTFSPGEPAVNIYTTGGGFAPHSDNQSITLNVLLSDLGAFTGGGTLFWAQDDDRHESRSRDYHDAVWLRPRQGTALLFNGDVQHAVKEVTSGIRHVYVGSFNLFNF